MLQYYFCVAVYYWLLIGLLLIGYLTYTPIYNTLGLSGIL